MQKRLELTSKTKVRNIYLPSQPSSIAHTAQSFRRCSIGSNFRCARQNGPQLTSQRDTQHIGTSRRNLYFVRQLRRWILTIREAQYHPLRTNTNRYFRTMKKFLSLLFIGLAISSSGQNAQIEVGFRLSGGEGYEYDQLNRNVNNSMEVIASSMYEVNVRFCSYVDGIRNHWNWSSFELGYAAVNNSISDPYSTDPYYGFVRGAEVYLLNTHSSLLTALYKPMYSGNLVNTRKIRLNWTISAFTGARVRALYRERNWIKLSISDPGHEDQSTGGSEASTVSWMTGLEPGLEYSWETVQNQRAIIRLSCPFYLERIWWTDESKASTTQARPTYGQLSIGYAF